MPHRSSWLGDHTRRSLFAALVAVMAFDYADRTLIGAMGPTLQTTFHASNAQIGFLVTSVNIVGALTTIPIGILTDKARRVTILALSVGVWSGAMVIVGAASSFVMLLIARLFLGVVTGTAGPVVPSLVGDLVDAKDRATAMRRLSYRCGCHRIPIISMGILVPRNCWRTTFPRYDPVDRAKTYWRCWSG